MLIAALLGGVLGSMLDPSHTVVWAVFGYTIRNYVLALVASIVWRLFVQLVFVMPSLEMSQTAMTPLGTIAPIVAAVLVTSIAWLLANRRRKRALLHDMPPHESTPAVRHEEATKLSDATSLTGLEDGATGHALASTTETPSTAAPNVAAIHLFWFLALIATSSAAFTIGSGSTNPGEKRLLEQNAELSRQVFQANQKVQILSDRSSKAPLLFSTIDIELASVEAELRSIPNVYDVDLVAIYDIASCKAGVADFQQFVNLVSLRQDAALSRIQQSRSFFVQLKSDPRSD